MTCLALSKLAKAAPISCKRVQIKTKRRVKKNGGIRKRVQFAETNNTVIPRDQSIDVFTLWYNENEYRNFLLDARRTLLELRRANKDVSQLDPSEYCIRGLEKHQLPVQARAMYKEQNREFIRFIICEHVRLRQEGKAPDETLKALSCAFTNPAQRYAHYLAHRQS